MRREWLTLCIAAALGVGAAVAAPQDQSPAPEPPANQGQRHMDPARQLKMLTKRLNLTDDQQKQLLPILTDRQQQFDSIRNDSSLAPKDRGEKMRSVREDTDGKIKAILNDSQKQTYEQMQQQMRERRQQHRDQPSN
jgi:periplasmic protein CpxP/Spy